MADQLPFGLVAFGPSANCTLDLCPLEVSILGYQPSIPASSVFIALFGLSLIAHAVQGVWMRTWGFMVAMICGCILEMVGYGGRIIIHDNPFEFQGFLMQIICITIAPVFFCAAIYVLLSQVINHVDVSLSRFKPKIFYWAFIPCDVVSLVLQALGGALSSTGGDRDAVQVGVNISLAGLVFQVATLLVFAVFFVDYILSCKRSSSWARVTKPLKFFLVFLFLAYFLILLRCVYRIVELHDGYFSEWFRDQPLFIALESAVMSAAAICLNIGHPGYAFKTERGEKSVEIDSP